MDPPNADVLELKEKMGELIHVMQEFALGQKVIAEKVGRIEDWLKMGNMQGNASSSGPKKSFGNDQREHEGESSAVYAQGGHGRDRYYQHTAAVTIPAGNQSVRQQRQPPQQRAGYQMRGKGVDRHFDKPPVTYAVLFKKLMDLGLVQPRAMVPMRSDQRPPNYDENARCEFHSGTPGHNIEGCRAFKNVVQDLVDSKAINFAPSPNVNANPMPAHGQAMVSAIAEDSDHACVMGEETDGNCKFDGWIKRGIRQGDPLSPMLFIIMMEYMNKSLTKMQKDHNFNYHAKCEKLSLTNLTFADDVLLFSIGDQKSVEMLLDAFNMFFESTGLIVKSTGLNVARRTQLVKIYLMSYLSIGCNASQYL
ncbi:uncharacterized protein LOC127078819 [Lathyrus oleraceus]|uniref:uncharacterized protein LOC127078819 n=1 Tax=Pisum sativum TaxID=3888 RepID=UPI0021CE00BD|nr:uncharacterized protein LOC127078819 [Pisum sativum]